MLEGRHPLSLWWGLLSWLEQKRAHLSLATLSFPVSLSLLSRLPKSSWLLLRVSFSLARLTKHRL